MFTGTEQAQIGRRTKSIGRVLLSRSTVARPFTEPEGSPLSLQPLLLTPLYAGESNPPNDSIP
jgi:hypothetical protein